MGYRTGIDQGDVVSPPLQLQCSRQTEYAGADNDNRLFAVAIRGRVSHCYDQAPMSTAPLPGWRTRRGPAAPRNITLATPNPVATRSINSPVAMSTGPGSDRRFGDVPLLLRPFGL